MPAVAAAGPVLVTDRSVAVATVLAVVEELLAELESAVVLPMTAVLLTVLLLGALELTASTTVKVALAPAGSAAMVSEIVPVPPAGGVVRVKAGPLVCVSETNVVLPGSTSVTATLWASLGPLLVTEIVNVRLLPAVTVAGAVLVTARSATVTAVVVTLELL